MINKCPCCGHRFADPDAAPDLVEELTSQFAAICAQNDYAITDGRVSEVVAAALLGIRKKKLAMLRSVNNGPPYFNLPVDGSRYSYELKSLAKWKHFQKTGEEWDMA
ncbi:hypothetical protein [Rhodanobacter glycinis]|uniref:hypothetical protein n=1 Tax=Rhodanobacter glycinis TaxID=582702 RepID=UPI00112B7447|nr:hypothetical protein [Rhodanobacter glycinis]